MNRAEIEAGFRQIQASFAAGLESVDPLAERRAEEWERDGGGGGESWTLAGPGGIERAAVNFSAVWGDMPATMSEKMMEAGPRFYATGVSIIVHPLVPQAPTFHANLRYFETDTTAWFGGGADLTPYYLVPEDASHFHRVLADVCLRHSVADYPQWKTACDRYFYLPHRGETRGVGGIFFDHLTERLDDVWLMQQDLGKTLTEAYLPILERRVTHDPSPDQVRWHELRRGRYVEFNLVWDRGTRFGLDSGGRTASILASLPPRARWDESFVPVTGSPEADLLGLVSGPPREWI